MNPRSYRKEKKLGPPVVASLLFHLLLLVAFTRLQFFTPTTISEPPVYVDLMNLPVAHPQAGAPAAVGNEPSTPAPAQPPAQPPAPAEMKLPAKTKSTKAPAPTKPESSTETSKEFAERLARLERQAEARHAAAAIDALRKKVGSGSGKAGAPGGTGNEAGSYYPAYIRSRLEDAFRVEDTFKPDRNKVVIVRLTIGRAGRITSLQVEKSSPDKMFNDAVMRSITRAERDFPKTPDGNPVTLSFVFKPQEVGNR
ncbi:MAG TPA: energy transducer TonB [Geobacteraceae bacterium]